MTSPLLNEKRAGIFALRRLRPAALLSDTKFDSGTGWPSFWAAIEGASATKQRQEPFHGPHRGALPPLRWPSGHVFDDGPPPTGQRYCINGVALVSTRPTHRPDKPTQLGQGSARRRR